VVLYHHLALLECRESRNMYGRMFTYCRDSFDGVIQSATLERRLVSTSRTRFNSTRAKCVSSSKANVITVGAFGWYFVEIS